MNLTKYLFLFPCLFMIHSAFATISQTGFVTPTTLTYYFTSINAISTDGTYPTLVSDPFTVTFHRTDADFAAQTLSDIQVPFGRYLGISACRTSRFDVTLNGVSFDGPNGNGNIFTHGVLLYTIKTDNSAGSISTIQPNTPVVTTASGSAGCGATYFPKPICVTDDNQSSCNAGDLVFTSSGQVTNTQDGTPPTGANISLQIYMLLDLYDSVTIDGAAGQFADSANIQTVVGQPGAAIHLAQSDSSGTTNVSFLFDSVPSLLTASVNHYPGGTVGVGNVPQLCSGSSNAAITGAPPGAAQTSGIVYFGTFDKTANANRGKIQVPATSTCLNKNSCNSNGVNVFQNFIQSVGLNATGICIADSATTPAYLGYTYIGGNGYTGGLSAATLPVVRVVDPTNIFNICTGSYVSNHPGTCSSVNGGTDGYY